MIESIEDIDRIIKENSKNCVNCRHYRESVRNNYGKEHQICIREIRREVDIVNGGEIVSGYLSCGYERESTLKALCNPRGRWFNRCGTNGKHFRHKQGYTQGDRHGR